jgi:hypothetical protein
MLKKIQTVCRAIIVLLALLLALGVYLDPAALEPLSLLAATLGIAFWAWGRFTPGFIRKPVRGIVRTLLW